MVCLPSCCMMVGSRGRKMIVNSGKWPCGVCGKGVQTNSVQCTLCTNWIHKQEIENWITGVCYSYVVSLCDFAYYVFG